jgi:hypothetical protein
MDSGDSRHVNDVLLLMMEADVGQYQVVEHRNGAILLTFPVVLPVETSPQLSQVFCADFGSLSNQCGETILRADQDGAHPR